VVRWQYEVLRFETGGVLGGKLDTEAFRKSLDELGLKGWELVSCFDTNQAYGASRDVIAVLKRPV
jgi:hypothetical protein